MHPITNLSYILNGSIWYFWKSLSITKGRFSNGLHENIIRVSRITYQQFPLISYPSSIVPNLIYWLSSPGPSSLLVLFLPLGTFPGRMSDSANHLISRFGMIRVSLNSLKLITLLTLILLAICFLLFFHLLCLIFRLSLLDPGGVCNIAFQF